MALSKASKGTFLLFFLVMLAVLLGLGAWQLHRAEWKKNIIEIRRAQLALPMVDYVPNSDMDALLYRPLRMRARMTDKSFSVFKGVEKNCFLYQLYHALLLPDDRMILYEGATASSCDKDKPNNSINEDKLTGILIPTPEKNSWQSGAAQSKDGTWGWIDLPAMAQQAGLPTLQPYIFVPSSTNKTATEQRFLAIPNNHLAYAATWFSLAFVLVILYFFAHRKNR